MQPLVSLTQILQSLILFAGVVSVAIGAVANIRKTSREQTEQIRKENQLLLDLQADRIKALETRLIDLQDQSTRHTEVMARHTRENERWVNRNAELYEVCLEQNRLLLKHGIEGPKLPNGGS